MTSTVQRLTTRLACSDEPSQVHAPRGRDDRLSEPEKAPATPTTHDVTEASDPTPAGRPSTARGRDASPNPPGPPPQQRP